MERRQELEQLVVLNISYGMVNNAGLIIGQIFLKTLDKPGI